MRFKHQCTRFVNGKCRLHGYPCDIKVNRGESHLITTAREMACYWFTRDLDEGKRELSMKVIRNGKKEETSTST